LAANVDRHILLWQPSLPPYLMSLMLSWQINFLFVSLSLSLSLSLFSKISHSQRGSDDGLISGLTND